MTTFNPGDRVKVVRESEKFSCLNEFWEDVGSGAGTVVKIDDPFFDIDFDNIDYRLWFPADMLELEVEHE